MFNLKKIFIPFTIVFFVACLFVNLPMNAEARAPRPLKVDYSDLNKDAKVQVDCLAQNIYFESGYEPTDGQIAVAMVTINRLESGFAPTICQVVKQKVAHTCQFSWVCEYKNIKSINQDVYLRVRALAVYVYANQKFIKDPSLGALYYHADYVKPGWKNMVYLTKIGHHKFYNKKENA